QGAGTPDPCQRRPPIGGGQRPQERRALRDEPANDREQEQAVAEGRTCPPNGRHVGGILTKEDEERRRKRRKRCKMPLPERPAAGTRESARNHAASPSSRPSGSSRASQP